MAATHGKLPEFNPDGGNFDVFLERFETYAEANDVTGDQKRAVFLTALPAEVYPTLQALLFPKTHRQASFEEVSSALKTFYSPRGSVVSARYRFNKRKQHPSETITDFIIAMREIAAHCKFGGFLQDALRDRLIVGLRNKSIRDRLLVMPDEEASWEKACHIAKEMEAVGVQPLSSPARTSTTTANIAAPQSDTSVKGETPTASKAKVPMTMPHGTKQMTEEGGARSDTTVKGETPTAVMPEVPMTMSGGTKQMTEEGGARSDTTVKGETDTAAMPEVPMTILHGTKQTTEQDGAWSETTVKGETPTAVMPEVPMTMPGGTKQMTEEVGARSDYTVKGKTDTAAMPEVPMTILHGTKQTTEQGGARSDTSVKVGTPTATKPKVPMTMPYGTQQTTEQGGARSDISVKVGTPTTTKPKVPMTMPHGTKQTTEQGGARSDISVKVGTPTTTKPKVPMTMPHGTKQTTEQGGERSDTSFKVETPTASKPKVLKTMSVGNTQTIEPRGKHRLSASAPDTPLHRKKVRFSVPEDASHSSKQDVHDQKGIAFDRRNYTQHPTRKRYICQFCEKICSARNKFEAHVRTHTGERPFKCPFCKEKFGQPNSLRRHRNERHPKNWKRYCDICESGYDTYEQLIKHLDRSTDEKHKSLERPSYVKCPFCKEKFRRRSSLRKHRNEGHLENWPFYCKTCKRGYDPNRQMRKHLATHPSSDISTGRHRKALKRSRSSSEYPLGDDSSRNDDSWPDDDSNESNDDDDDYSYDGDSNDDESNDSNDDYSDERNDDDSYDSDYTMHQLGDYTG
ncbi:uncharacterized protein LOC144142676 [Haemaphysalis longicornis]